MNRLYQWYVYYLNLSNRHLAANNKTYIEHFWFATYCGLQCIKIGLIFLLHGILPAIYQNTGSNKVSELNQMFVEMHKSRQS